MDDYIHRCKNGYFWQWNVNLVLHQMSKVLVWSGKCLLSRIGIQLTIWIILYFNSCGKYAFKSFYWLYRFLAENFVATKDVSLFCCRFLSGYVRGTHMLWALNFILNICTIWKQFGSSRFKTNFSQAFGKCNFLSLFFENKEKRNEKKM